MIFNNIGFEIFTILFVITMILKSIKELLIVIEKIIEIKYEWQSKNLHIKSKKMDNKLKKQKLKKSDKKLTLQSQTYK